MLKINKYTLMISIVALVALIGVWTNADDVSTIPGSADDPLITKSYLDEQVEKIVSAELQNSLKLLENKTNAQDSGNGLADFNILTLMNEKMLILGQGAEVVVRSGKATIFSPDANGVSNLSAGTSLANGQSVPNNSLLLFPREGRGIQSANNSDLIVLVRGKYQLKPLVKP